jgi:hypothetical protein
MFSQADVSYPSDIGRFSDSRQSAASLSVSNLRQSAASSVFYPRTSATAARAPSARKPISLEHMMQRMPRSRHFRKNGAPLQ